MKRAIIINVMTLITFGLMKAAWELATEGQKMHGGKKSEYLGASMRQAWAVKKAGCTEEAAYLAGGYEFSQKKKDGIREIKKQTALAAQKATHNDAGDAELVAQYFAMQPQPTPKKAIASAHEDYAMYAAMPNIQRKPAAKDYEFNQDIQTEHSQESFDDDCASQDAGDWTKCKRCGMAALKEDIKPKSFRAHGSSTTEYCCGKCRQKLDIRYNGGSMETKNYWANKSRETRKPLSFAKGRSWA